MKSLLLSDGFDYVQQTQCLKYLLVQLPEIQTHCKFTYQQIADEIFDTQFAYKHDYKRHTLRMTDFIDHVKSMVSDLMRTNVLQQDVYEPIFLPLYNLLRDQRHPDLGVINTILQQLQLLFCRLLNRKVPDFLDFNKISKNLQFWQEQELLVFAIDINYRPFFESDLFKRESFIQQIFTILLDKYKQSYTQPQLFSVLFHFLDKNYKQCYQILSQESLDFVLVTNDDFKRFLQLNPYIYENLPRTFELRFSVQYLLTKFLQLHPIEQQSELTHCNIPRLLQNLYESQKVTKNTQNERLKPFLYKQYQQVYQVAQETLDKFAELVVYIYPEDTSIMSKIFKLESFLWICVQYFKVNQYGFMYSQEWPRLYEALVYLEEDEEVPRHFEDDAHEE